MWYKRQETKKKIGYAKDGGGVARYRFVASSSGFKPFTLDYANGMTIMRRIIFPRAQIPPTMDRYPSSTRQEDPLLHGRNEFFHANGNDRETVRDHFGRRKPPRWTRWKILFAVHGRSSRVSSPPPIWISSIRFSNLGEKGTVFGSFIRASVKILGFVYLF